MNNEEKDFLEEFKKIKVLQKCPQCGKLALRYNEGKLVCSNCSYSQEMREI